MHLLGGSNLFQCSAPVAQVAVQDVNLLLCHPTVQSAVLMKSALAFASLKSCELLQLRTVLHGGQLLVSGLTSSVVAGLATSKFSVFSLHSLMEFQV